MPTARDDLLTETSISNFDRIVEMVLLTQVGVVGDIRISSRGLSGSARKPLHLSASVSGFALASASTR
jgi:hypothetical protein